jgi:uncharacterized protein (TIGR03435 family)
MGIKWLPSIAFILLALSIEIGAHAQSKGTPSLTFDVASVKLNPNLKASASKILNAGGLIYTFVTLSDCIQTAYNVKSYQVSGPEWIRSEHYDINARAEGSPSKDQVLNMFQSLLAERFRLKVHREQKEVPVYALSVNKAGHRLKPRAGEEPMTLQFADGGMTFQSASIAEFIQFLASFSFDRSLVDNTGLTGKFDFSLKIVGPDANVGDVKRALSQNGSSVIMDAVAPLGLKLEPQKQLADVVVLDQVERPVPQN